MQVINQQSTLILELQKRRLEEAHIQQQQNISIANLSEQFQSLRELILEGMEKRKYSTTNPTPITDEPPSKRSHVESVPAEASAAPPNTNCFVSTRKGETLFLRVK